MEITLKEPSAFGITCEWFDSFGARSRGRLTQRKPRHGPRWPGKIVIVDDNEIDQLRATVLAGEFGLSVEVANSGRQALALLESSDDISLVLLDCDMPDLSGFVVARVWRSIEIGRGTSIPIVGLSRHSSDDYAACLGAGMSDCLRKPIRREELARCFAHWLPAPTLGRRPDVSRTEMYEQ
jgi:CheY-like chemotaxis protein